MDSLAKLMEWEAVSFLQGGLTWHMNKTGISVNGYLKLGEIVQIVDPFNL